MSDVVGLAIIGAGPAGMSAAIAAREHGTDVLVLDEQAAPGGQIYRNVEAVTAERPSVGARARRGLHGRRGPHSRISRVRCSVLAAYVGLGSEHGRAS